MGGEHDRHDHVVQIVDNIVQPRPVEVRQHLLDAGPSGERAVHLAEQQSQQIIGEGRALGERLKAELLEKAQQSSRQMLDQAKAEIQREKESALVELRSEAADLAVMAAGKLIDANLDTPKQRQLVDSVMKELTRNA